MKIRTIIGVLLVFALVLGSTGAAFAASDTEEDPDQARNQVRNHERLNDESSQGDGNRPCCEDGPCYRDGQPNGQGA
jgi:hypothetical protein